ncbi:DMT family transporter [Leptospira selangorensis]|uniref:DMT family transporter n=1 Tax=Leptospira selangorensis TaxID=2484982 RepID=A0A5F2BXQ0_9LEPT|nr:DMT family transporter [Leptospira selangorensis]TGM12110.1 DMT family transporter [Leptospira selangorensis]TGM14847.1 DMT family transporter [Leptospira selangorensis]
MNLLLPIIFALLSGLAMSIQPGINSILGKNIESPWLASTISFFVGTIALGIITFALGEMKSTAFLVQTIKEQPWWIWIGGFLGAIVVTSSLVFAPKIGATSWIALFLLGQVITSILLEKWGILGFPEKPISIQKMIGLGLLILSAWLVKKG